MTADYEWHLKREAVRGKPSWHYWDDSCLVRDLVKAIQEGEIPEEAVIDDCYVKWYGWPKDSNGPAEEWSLVNYG